MIVLDILPPELTHAESLGQAVLKSSVLARCPSLASFAPPDAVGRMFSIIYDLTIASPLNVQVVFDRVSNGVFVISC
jgi:hypothetical protein